MTKKRLAIFPNLSKEKVCIALPEIVDLCRDWGMEPVLPKYVAEGYNCPAYDKSDPDSLRTLSRRKLRATVLYYRWHVI
ncbi:MAG: hypothetical protein ACLT4X_04840 [Phascolarctobacterium sp.]